ncbi:hypothetical protein HanPSC8_Chr12g0541081 [Helianthus annuus]|nr:hypothetical protein HanPSC8_Chr12g0541081 [Helianthus annuus]
MKFLYVLVITMSMLTFVTSECSLSYIHECMGGIVEASKQCCEDLKTHIDCFCFYMKYYPSIGHRCLHFKITSSPPIQNKIMLLPPTQIYDFSLGVKIRFHPQFKFTFLPPAKNKIMVFPYLKITALLSVQYFDFPWFKIKI